MASSVAFIRRFSSIFLFRLFGRQDAREKRRLLDFVLLNCSWKNGELTPVFRQPFDIIAVGARLSAEKKADGADSYDLCPIMGPWVDTYRTVFSAPTGQMRELLEQMKSLEAVA